MKSLAEGAGRAAHRRLSCFAAITLLATSCSHWSGEAPVALSAAPIDPPPSAQTPDQQHAELTLARLPAFRRGLALSGGGVRSAMFNVGVLKALYDAGRLDDFDVVSTVSGGGYAGYWLYANEQTRDGDKTTFGAGSFEGDLFQQRVCELSRTGNFQTYVRMGRALAALRPSRASIAGYEWGLRRTFGAGESGTTTIAGLAAGTGTRWPYLVMNATVHDEPPRTGQWLRRLFEFTPLFRGNAGYGYWAWNDSSPPLYKLTAISGAAKPLLAQVEMLPSAGAPLRVPLFDGGKSENLGAVALIRRGVQDVTIVDAEHDPFYQFEAYRILRGGLAGYGLRLRIDALEPAQPRTIRPDWPSAAFHGHVIDTATRRSVSTVHYLKMGISLPVRAQLIAEREESSLGAASQRGLDRAQAKACVPSPLSRPTEIWAAYNAGSYERWLNERNAKARRINRIAPEAGKIYFPQYSTLDQSYHLDQLRAFVGLGYLEGRELIASLPRGHN